MSLPEQGSLLRIYVGENDKYQGKLLYEWIVAQARENGLAGATVLRGMMGFGAHSRLHTFKIGTADTSEKLESFLPVIDPAIKEGLATLERVQITFYRSGNKR